MNGKKAVGAAAIVGLAAGALVAATAAQAHHGLAGEFDMTKPPVERTGVISKVNWINPHIYLTLDVKGPGGAVTKYRVETVPVFFARKVGVTAKDLQGQGMTVKIKGQAGRIDPNLMFGSEFVYSNGRKINFGQFKE